MIKNERGISLVNLIVLVIIVLILLAIVTTILTGENGLINQYKEEKKNDTEYVIKTNDEQGNVVVMNE